MFGVNFWVEKGNKAFEEGNLLEALRCFENVVERDSDHFFSWVMLGHINVRLERFEQAAISYNIVINGSEDDMDLSYALSGQAFLFSLKGDFEKAVSACEVALGLCNQNEEAKELIKVINQINNQNQQQFNSFNSSASIYSDNSSRYNFSNSRSNSSNFSSIDDQTPNFLKYYGDFEPLFTEDNLMKLMNTSFDEVQYAIITRGLMYIFDSVIGEKIREDYENYSKLDILDKIAILANAFAKINYKSRGAELGSYSFNVINVDDRLDDSQQISTLIHELSHHLLAEIFEQAYAFNLEGPKTNESEAVVNYGLLHDKRLVLMNEYCAHTVEGRFIPHGYQNYGSFNNILNQFDLSDEDELEAVKFFLVLGNTFAEDIIEMLETYIDFGLRNEIKRQYKFDYNYPPNYEGILLETKDVLPEENKLKFVNLILAYAMVTSMNNYEDLVQVRDIFAVINDND